MIVSKVSILTGKISDMDLNVTKDQIHRWESGELIQNAMPNLSIMEREFLINGMSIIEQEDMFHN